MGPRLPITTVFRLILAGAALQLLGACATMPEPETGVGQKVGSAQILSICEKLSKSNDTRLAMGLCEKAHIEDPENPVPLLLLADMLQQQGALAEAGRAFGMAIDLDPDNVEAHYGLGKVFLARNQFELAIEQFEMARELNGRDHRLYNAIGVVLDNLGDHVGAQRHYRTGLELAPNNHALLKNLMLSRRLDDSVTTPAIGPRHKVVPAPASEPGSRPNQNTPAVTPGTEPMATPSAQPRPDSGRLGHKPLAQDSDRAVPADGRSSQQLAVNEESAVEIEDSMRTQPEAVPVTVTRVIETRAPAIKADQRLASREAMAEAPSESGTLDNGTTLATASDNGDLAYYPIVLPSQKTVPTSSKDRVQTVSLEQFTYSIDSLIESVWTTSASLETVLSVSEKDELAVVTPEAAAVATTAPETVTPDETETAAVAAATIVSGSDGSIDRGPEIIAAGIEVYTVKQEELAALETAPRRARAIAYQTAGTSGEQTEQVSAPRSRTVRVLNERASPTASSIAPSLAAYTSSASATGALSFAADHSVVTSSGAGFTDKPLTRLSSRTRDTTPGAPELRVTPQARAIYRFGREHEENHETRQVEGELWDLVDVVNPLQHLPVVASIYRDVTEDEIKPAARIAGGSLFGGVLGFATSLVDSVIKEASGRDIGEMTIAVLRRNSADEDPDDTGRTEMVQSTLADEQLLFSGLSTRDR